ncbi:MAG: peptidylprolyl isomerase [Candidatus Eisenbacteria bacterium]|uniref:Peptidylprolyl isomerase n=1 Tax=Eiseniibacteriota bacterium TaxID=2212470 RepID=A0A937X926_UNCEI|nr:peptidylprolyl isomerase [Candidatus Eisenbacteria bacterium]
MSNALRRPNRRPGRPAIPGGERACRLRRAGRGMAWAALLLWMPFLGPPGAAIVERIVATVDDEPILLSDVEARVAVELQGLQVAAPDSALLRELRQQVRESLIEQLVLAREAEERQLRVPPEEVAHAVEEAILRNQQILGSPARFREQLQREGVTEEELRQRFAADAQREILAARLVQSELRERVALDPEEIRRYYDEHLAELPEREEAFLLQRIVWLVTPDSTHLARTEALAADVAAQVRAGTLTFPDAARRYSDDPNGREGGDLHRLQRGDLAGRLGQDFETAAFALSPLTVGGPLLSPLGFHLLWVHDRDPQGQWIHLSHVLFRVPVLRADVERARSQAEAVLARARAGEPFDELARRHSSAPEGPQGGFLQAVPLGAMEPPLQQAVLTLDPGGTSGVIELEGAFLILRLIEREPARPFRFEEIEEELVGWVRARKMETLYEEWIVDLLERHHIERRAWE